MAASDFERAINYFKRRGILDEQGVYNFGDKDSHLLRAYYLIAIGEEIIFKKAFRLVCYDRLSGDNRTTPPWENPVNENRPK